MAPVEVTGTNKVSERRRATVDFPLPSSPETVMIEELKF
jgi:hypothetical protein